MARSIEHLRRLRRDCTPVPAGRERRLPLWLSMRDRGRKALLCVSDQVAVASMLGLGRPLIALPRSLLDGLSDDELDQVVLHEYGHVQCRDDWTKLAQVLIEAVCGLHPGVRWAGRALDREREAACDDWVISRSGSPRAYASCLAKVASLPSRRAPLALLQAAARSSRDITWRVERMLTRTGAAGARPSPLAFVGGVSLLVVVVLLLGRLAPIVAFSRPDARVEVANRALLRPVQPQHAPSADGSNSEILATAPLVSAPIQATASSSSKSARVLSSRVLSVGFITHPIEQIRDQNLARMLMPLTRDEEQVVRGESILAPGEPQRLRSGAETQSDEESREGRDDEPGAEEEIDREGPWRALAGAGVAVGKGASTAGLATADVFTRLGSSFKRAFSIHP